MLGVCIVLVGSVDLGKHSLAVSDLPDPKVGWPFENCRRLLNGKSTIGDVLALDLYRLRIRSQTTLHEAIRTRRILLGFREAIAASNKQESAANIPADRPQEQLHAVTREATGGAGKRPEKASRNIVNPGTKKRNKRR
jgi:hypothetical protein